MPVLQPQRTSEPQAVDALLATGADVLVVCAYGQILAQTVLDAIPTVVVHPSLVPRWRGAAPVERALMAGETELGVTILKMTAGVDEGPVGASRTVDVPRDADAGRAYELLAAAAVEALLETLDAHAGRDRPLGRAARRTHLRGQDRGRGQADRLAPAGAADRRPGQGAVPAHRRRDGAARAAHPYLARRRRRRAASLHGQGTAHHRRPGRAGSRSSSCSRTAGRG